MWIHEFFFFFTQIVRSYVFAYVCVCCACKIVYNFFVRAKRTPAASSFRSVFEAHIYSVLSSRLSFYTHAYARPFIVSSPFVVHPKKNKLLNISCVRNKYHDHVNSLGVPTVSASAHIGSNRIVCARRFSRCTFVFVFANVWQKICARADPMCVCYSYILFSLMNQHAPIFIPYV